MQSVTFVCLAAMVAVALADGEYYVPRSYYIIDAEGHASVPVPLRRLVRSLNPYGNGYGGASANANANANARANGWGGGSANANANAEANANAGGGWAPPGGYYGAANPLSSGGLTRRQYGTFQNGRSVLASSSAGMDSSGAGYYETVSSIN